MFPFYIPCEYIVIFICAFCYIFLDFLKVFPITDDNQFDMFIFWEYICIICFYEFKYSFFRTDPPNKTYYYIIMSDIVFILEYIDAVFFCTTSELSFIYEVWYMDDIISFKNLL